MPFVIKQGASYLKRFRRYGRVMPAPKSRIKDASSFASRGAAEEVAVQMGCKLEPGMASVIEVLDGKEVVP